MSVHLNIDQSGVVGVCLNRMPERQCIENLISLLRC